MISQIAYVTKIGMTKDQNSCVWKTVDTLLSLILLILMTSVIMANIRYLHDNKQLPNMNVE